MFDYNEKILVELAKKENEKYAIDFAHRLSNAGVKVNAIYYLDFSDEERFCGIHPDFSKHDKKVMESAQKYIDKLKTENEALRKQVEELKKQNTEIRECRMKLQNDSTDEIRELKAEIQRLREKCGKVPKDDSSYTQKEFSFTINKENATISLPYDFITHCSEKAFEEIKKGHWTGVVIKTAEEIKNLPFVCKRTEDLLSELVSYEKMPSSRKTTREENGVNFESLCKELQDQHQQDCITINRLHVTIDKLVDRYANLRKNVGVD